MSESERFGSWVVLELFGHRRLAGYLTEQQIGGAGFLRLDIPAIDGEQAATQYYGPSTVYCITPVTEEAARAVARRQRPEPIHYYELPAPNIHQPTRVRDDEDDDGLDEVHALEHQYRQGFGL